MTLTIKGRTKLWEADRAYTESATIAYRRLFGTDLDGEPSIGPVDDQGDFTVARTAVVSWNGNQPETWRCRRLEKLYREHPPSYLRYLENQRRAGW